MVASHNVTAEVAVTRAAYDVVHPAVTLYQTSFETIPGTLASQGWIRPAPEHSSFDGEHHTGVYSAFAITYNTGLGDVKPTPLPHQTNWTRTFTGLVASRSYTFTAWVSNGGLGVDGMTKQARLGVVGIGASAYVTLTVSESSVWKKLTYTFMATTHTHQLQITGNDTDTTGAVHGFLVDDVALVKDAWTEHFPASTDTPTPVDVISADVALYETWAPYAQTTLECWTPPEEVLAGIDPRTVSRLTVHLTDGTLTRNFNLMLRSREVDHLAGTMVLTGGSDEAILIDKARVATTVDNSAAAYQSSLRALINNVILAPIGAVLQADAGADADLTVYADQTNLITNPSAEVDTAGWTAQNVTVTKQSGSGSASSGTNSFRLSAPAAAASCMISAPISVTPGATYVLQGTIYVDTAAAGTANTLRRQYVLMDATTSAVLGSTPIVAGTVSTAPVPGSVEVVIPAGTTSVVVRAYLGTTVGAMRFDGIKFAQKVGAQDDAYFDGSTPDDAHYHYAWTGTAHASTSTRTVIGTARNADMFRWLPGVTAWDFVQPLVQAGALRFFCDEARRWHLVDPETYTVPGLVTIDAKTNAQEATDTISRFADWFDSVVIAYQWDTVDGLSHAAWDIAGAPGTKTLTVEKHVPYPGPGAAAALLKRAQGRGRVLDLTAISDYHTTPGMAIRATLPDTPIQDGTIADVTWTLPDDTMDVGSRAAAAVAKQAWTYLAAGVKWTDSPVGASWVSEPI